MDTRPRVVVTGIGVVTSVGIGREMFWRHLLEGRCGIGPVESFDTSRYNVHLGGEVKGFAPEAFVKRVEPGSIGRGSQLAIAAARLALDDAGIATDSVDPRAVGVSIGTTSGEPEFIERFDDMELAGARDRIGPEFIGRYPCHVLAAHVGSELGFRGPNLVIPTACAAGNYAVAHALDSLRAGEADVMLAGGSDAFSRITYTGFARLGAIAPERCQPFDRDRKGMIPGEGAAVLVLEDWEHAVARGARIYAEIAGWASNADAHHITAPEPEGAEAARAIRLALADAGIDPAEVDYVNAHGTSTPLNDRSETVAIEAALGERARSIPVSSTKSAIGHLLGAAGAVEAAATILALRGGIAPPTVGWEVRDEGLELDYVPGAARALPSRNGDGKGPSRRIAISNSFGFGGHNAVLCLAGPQEAP
jgi:3-oxoacyl-[acyl-carrier-protein] synthase II